MNFKNLIKLAGFSDKKELTELWIETFGDDEKFISSFLDAYLIPEYNVPVIIRDKKIVSALYLIEFPLYSKSEIIGNCQYLFAAATKKEYQNNGYMSELIKYSADLCRNRGVHAIFLFPQNQSGKLFDYYSKFGFKSIYGAEKIISKKNTDLSEYKLEKKIITDVNVFDRLYDAYFEFASKQELSPVKDRLFYFKCAASYLDNPGSYFAVLENNSENNVEKFCYVFYKKYNNNYYINDIILLGNNNIQKIIEILSCFNLEIIVPATSKFTENRHMPLAMLLPLSNSASNITNNLEYPVYINMFMNI